MTTRRDQEERVDVPLADSKENQVDERHESWKSMYFESCKEARKLEVDVLRVIQKQLLASVEERNIASCSWPRAAAPKLRRRLDAQSPPPHMSMLASNGHPKSGRTKSRKSTLKCGRGEVGSELGSAWFSLAFAVDTLNVTGDILVPPLRLFFVCRVSDDVAPRRSGCWAGASWVDLG